MGWTEAGDAQLESWGLSRQQAEAVHLFEVADASAFLPSCPARPGIVIPYYRPDGQQLRINDAPFGRVRWLNVPQQSGFHGKVKAPRYGQPAGTNVQVYFPPGIDWDEVLANPNIGLVITEGEIKSIIACQQGFNCIALGGVYNFANKGGLVKVLDDAIWKAREVCIIYDSDAATNPDVLAAEARLVEELGTTRQANVKVVRLPEEGDKKVGLDDFIHAHGADELVKLIDQAEAMTALDAKVVALNKACAWVDQEGKVYDLEQKQFIEKGDFINGSRFSAIKHITRGEKGMKILSVAERWLKHPHAQRYNQVLFRPGEGQVVPAEQGAGAALNLWLGWNEEEGDVAPFLRLTDWLVSREPNAEIRELPLKLLAYKAQHPQDKIPMALVFTGPQGSGKTLWADIVLEAFGPYSTEIDPNALTLDFHPWLETSVVAAINELDVQTMKRNAELIKALITDPRRQLNDKFRTIRMVTSPTFYIITSNYSGVGSGFGHDDRRILAIQAPSKHPTDEAFYGPIWRWRKAGGRKALMHYLLNYDLGSWQPPSAAPATATKRLAYREGLSPVQLLAEDMRISNFNSIMYWISLAGEWAAAQEIGGDPKAAAQARAVKAGLDHIQVRPWYTAEELTLIFPTVLAQVYSTRDREVWTPGGLSRVLRDTGIPFLVNRENPDGFAWQGKMRQYLVISQFNDWAEPIGQADFERSMKNWPTFGQVMQEQRKAHAH